MMAPRFLLLNWVGAAVGVGFIATTKYAAMNIVTRYVNMLGDLTMDRILMWPKFPIK